MQITASVTFLPLLSDRCSFDLLVYTNAESAVPMEWCATSFHIMTTDITQCANTILSAEQGLLLYQTVLKYTYTQRMVQNCDSRPFLLCREESDARVIINAADVKLRSFNTKVKGAVPDLTIKAAHAPLSQMLWRAF